MVLNSDECTFASGEEIKASRTANHWAWSSNIFFKGPGTLEPFLKQWQNLREWPKDEDQTKPAAKVLLYYFSAKERWTTIWLEHSGSVRGLRPSPWQRVPWKQDVYADYTSPLQTELNLKAKYTAPRYCNVWKTRLLAAWIALERTMHILFLYQVFWGIVSIMKSGTVI